MRLDVSFIDARHYLVVYEMQELKIEPFAASKDIALLIGEETCKLQGDIRDVISVSKLVKMEIAEIINTLTKYGEQRK